MYSTYALMKNILNINDEIAKNYKQIKFKQEKFEKKYKKFTDKKFNKIIQIPSIIIFVIHIFYVLNSGITLGEVPLLGNSVFFLFLDLCLLLAFFYLKINKNKNRNFLNKFGMVLTLRSAFLVCEYLLNLVFCYLNPSKNVKYFYTKIIFYFTLVKNLFYLFLLPNNYKIAFFLHIPSLIIMLFYFILSNFFNQILGEENNDSVINKHVNLLRNLNEESLNNINVNDLLVHIKNSYNLIDILLESMIFIGTYFLKRYINIQLRRTFLAKYKFQNYYNYCDELMSGLNGYHIAFINSKIAYVDNNLKYFINKRFKKFYQNQRSSYNSELVISNDRNLNSNNFSVNLLNYENSGLNNNFPSGNWNKSNNCIIENNLNKIGESSKSLDEKNLNLIDEKLCLDHFKHKFNFPPQTNYDEIIQKVVNEFLRNIKDSKNPNINLLEKINNLNYRITKLRKITQIESNDDNSNYFRKTMTKTFFKLKKYNSSKKVLITDNKADIRIEKNFMNEISTVPKNVNGKINLIDKRNNDQLESQEIFNETNKNLISIGKIELNKQDIFNQFNETNVKKYEKSIKTNSLKINENLNIKNLDNDKNNNDLKIFKISNDDENTVIKNKECYKHCDNLKAPRFRIMINNNTLIENKNENNISSKIISNSNNINQDSNIKLRSEEEKNKKKKIDFYNINDILKKRIGESDLSSKPNYESENISENQNQCKIIKPSLFTEQEEQKHENHKMFSKNYFKDLNLSKNKVSRKASCDFNEFENDNSYHSSQTIKKQFTQISKNEQINEENSMDSSFSSNNEKFINNRGQKNRGENKKFKKLGEFFIELNEKRKDLAVYYRILNNVLNIYLYDYTKIKKAENISSENKIKHKILAKIAHEFKTPLNSILGLIDNLKSESKSYLFKKDLNIIKALSNYTIYLISDVIHYASNDYNTPYKNVKKLLNNPNYESDDRKGKLNSEFFNNNNREVNSSAKMEYKSTIEMRKNLNIIIRNIDVKYCLFFCFDILNALLCCNENKMEYIKSELYIENKLNLFNVQTDEIRLNQILINFISNSVKFTKRGSIALIANFLRKKNKKTTNSHERFYLKISVVDTGIGISEEEQKRLFTREIKLNTKHDFNHQGTGLGLTICANMIKILNIKIQYASKQDLGSIFSVLIPVEKITQVENKTNSIINGHIGRNKNYYDFSNNINKINTNLTCTYRDDGSTVLNPNIDFKNMKASLNLRNMLKLEKPVNQLTEGNFNANQSNNFCANKGIFNDQYNFDNKEKEVVFGRISNNSFSKQKFESHSFKNPIYFGNNILNLNNPSNPCDISELPKINTSNKKNVEQFKNYCRSSTVYKNENRNHYKYQLSISKVDDLEEKSLSSNKNSIKNKNFSFKHNIINPSSFIEDHNNNNTVNIQFTDRPLKKYLRTTSDINYKYQYLNDDGLKTFEESNILNNFNNRRSISNFVLPFKNILNIKSEKDFECKQLS